MAAGSDTHSPAGISVGAARLFRRGDIYGRAPGYPLERVCSHVYEPFQLKFARRAQQVMLEAKDIQMEASHVGLALRAETEAAFQSPVGILRDFYGDLIHIGPAAVRYHRGVTLEQPYMGVRVRCRAADFEAVKADLEARHGGIVDSGRTPSFGVVRAVAPLAYLLGYSESLANLTRETAHVVMRLSHYAPAQNSPPGGDAA
jgi:hypothetical protein